MNDRRNHPPADRAVFNAALRLGSAVLFLAILALWLILWLFASDGWSAPNFVLDALFPLLALFALLAVFKTWRTGLRMGASPASRDHPPAVRALGKAWDNRAFKGVLWLGIVGYLAFALPATALVWLFAGVAEGPREPLPSPADPLVTPTPSPAPASGAIPAASSAVAPPSAFASEFAPSSPIGGGAVFVRIRIHRIGGIFRISSAKFAFALRKRAPLGILKII